MVLNYKTSSKFVLNYFSNSQMHVFYKCTYIRQNAILRDWERDMILYVNFNWYDILVTHMQTSIVLIKN